MGLQLGVSLEEEVHRGLSVVNILGATATAVAAPPVVYQMDQPVTLLLTLGQADVFFEQ